MAEYCFDAVLAKLEHKNIPPWPAIVSNDKRCAFATVQLLVIPSLRNRAYQRLPGLDIGFHGLTDEGEELTAFYLPEVPIEKEWSEEMTVDELLCKAGFSG
ncbi:hypothetical protein AAVH_03134 [Aphelenchoides avenae]|nr:hypothetical protein AAVH_03134 [Aphelenchus avenae]